MGVFKDNHITDVGKQLQLEVQSGAMFIPTRIVIGSGYLPKGTTTKNITDVVTVVKSLEIIKKEQSSNGYVIFGGVYNNKDVTEPFYFRELGLYAKAKKEDGTELPEILYSYGNADVNAELIPTYNTGTLIEKQLDLIVYIGNDANVDLTIESGVYVTKEQLEQLFDQYINGLILAGHKSLQKQLKPGGLLLVIDGAQEIKEFKGVAFENAAVSETAPDNMGNWMQIVSVKGEKSQLIDEEDIVKGDLTVSETENSDCTFWNIY